MTVVVGLIQRCTVLTLSLVSLARMLNAAESDHLLSNSDVATYIKPISSFVPKFYVNPEIRTAAPSRGKMDSDRPHLYLYASALVDLPNAGSVGVGYWSDSELSNRVADKHRRVLFENDAIPFYRYVWNISQNLSWRNDLMYDIKVFGGYNQVDIPDYHDICLYSRMDNSFLTPYALIRRMLVPADDNRFDFRLGVLHSFNLPWGLSVMPGAYVDGGNGIQAYRRYGRKLNGLRDYNPGVNATVIFVQLNKKITENISVYAGIEDFHIIRHSAREIEDSRDDPTARNDMFLGLAGLRLSF